MDQGEHEDQETISTMGLAAGTINVHQDLTIYAGNSQNSADPTVPPTTDSKMNIVGVQTEKLKILGNATFYTGCTLPPKSGIKFPIRFNIQDPVESFFGRDQFLEDLHRAIQASASSNKMTVLSQLKIMSGLGGVGKTETTRKYILDHIASYENVIWINADNVDTLTSSFLRLAQNDLKIPTKNEEGKSRDLKTIMAAIYQILCTKVTLLIFDNADGGGASEKFDHQKNLKPFLPPSVLPPLLRPFILITSRRQDWGSLSRQVLCLNVFTEDESIEFILQELDLDTTDETNRNDARDLGQLLGHLPLALQQAVAYIREETLKGLLSNPGGFCVRDYINIFQLEPSRKDLLDHPLQGLEFDYEWTVFTTWRITMKKIREQVNGPLAVKIVEILSFLYADNTPAKLLFAILHESSPLEVSTSVAVLRKYSMIQHRVAEQFLGIHRLVQKVNLEDLKLQKDGIQQTIDEMVKPCNDFLLKLPLSDANYSEILQGLKSLVGNLKLLPPKKTIPYMNFKVEVSAAFREAGSYDEAGGLANETFLLRNELLGQDHPDTLHTADLLASILQCQGRYDEAKTMVDKIGQGWTKKFGSDHRAALLTQNNSGILLCRQGKYEEALTEFEKAYEAQYKVLGPNHEDTLNSRHNMAIVLKNLGRYPESVAIYQEVLRLQEIKYGDDHILTIRTRYNLAIVWECQGKLDEALELFKKVHDQRKTLMGPKHVDVIKPLINIAVVESEFGHNLEALKMLESAFKDMKDILGPDHIDTLMTGQRLAKVLRKLKRFDEALILLQETHASLVTSLQNESHPSVLETIDEIGGVFGDLSRFDEALKHLEIVFERRVQCHGKEHPATQKTEHIIKHLQHAKKLPELR